MTTYEQLKAKIVKHCPELKGHSYTMGHNPHLEKCICGDSLCDGVHTKKDTEPELRHVLLAIEKSSGENTLQATAYSEIMSMYNLTLPLKDQSPEILEWLNSIIQ